MIEFMFKSRQAIGQIQGEHYRINSPRHVSLLGEEFVGEDLRSGQPVTLVRLSDSLIGSERARERLQAASGFTELHHPALLAAYWAGFDSDQQYWLVQAVPPGKNLQAVENLDPHSVQKLLLDLSEALILLHQQGLVHQSIVPSQIYRTEIGEACLAGLPLGQLLLPNRLLQWISERGELDFLAPEQRQGLNIDARADQYALAACALWLLTGRKPGDVSWSQLLQERSAQSSLLQTLRKALSVQPEQRFADIESFCLACQGLKPQSSLLFRLSPSLTAIGLLTILMLVAMLWIRHGQQWVEPEINLIEQSTLSDAQRQAIPIWQAELSELYQHIRQAPLRQQLEVQRLEARWAALPTGRRSSAERALLKQQLDLAKQRLQLVAALQFTAPEDAILQQLMGDASSESYDLPGLNTWRQRLQQRRKDMDAIDPLLAEQLSLEQLQNSWKKVQQQARSPKEIREWLSEAGKELEARRFAQALQKTQQLNALYRSLLSRLPEIIELREQSMQLQAQLQDLNYRLALVTPELRKLQDLMAHSELKFSQGQLDDLVDSYRQLIQGFQSQLSLSQAYREAENQYLRDKQQWLDYARRNQLSLELPAALQQLEQQASNLTGKELASLTADYYPRLSQAYRDWLVELKERNRQERLAQWNQAQAGRVRVAAPIAQQQRFQPEFKTKAGWLKQIQSSMVEINGGTFFMGGMSRHLRPGTETYSSPKHQRRVGSFRISDHEVTFAEYDFYAKANKQRLPEDEGFGRGNRPVMNLNYAQVMAYIQWLNQQSKGPKFRLPTEAEWEFVAWAGRNHPDKWRLNPEENLPTAHCQSCLASSQFDSTVSVGSLLANPWGLFDLFGNVAEWTADCWHPNYQQQASSSGSAIQDKDCQMQVIRGGSYLDKLEWLNPLQRDPVYRQDRSPALGFRLAQDSP